MKNTIEIEYDARAVTQHYKPYIKSCRLFTGVANRVLRSSRRFHEPRSTPNYRARSSPSASSPNDDHLRSTSRAAFAPDDFVAHRSRATGSSREFRLKRLRTHQLPRATRHVLLREGVREDVTTTGDADFARLDSTERDGGEWKMGRRRGTRRGGRRRGGVGHSWRRRGWRRRPSRAEAGRGGGDVCVPGRGDSGGGGGEGGERGRGCGLGIVRSGSGGEDLLAHRGGVETVANLMGDPDEFRHARLHLAVEIVHARVARQLIGVGAHQTDVPWGGGMGKGEDEAGFRAWSGRVEGTRRGNGRIAGRSGAHRQPGR